MPKGKRSWQGSPYESIDDGWRGAIGRSCRPAVLVYTGHPGVAPLPAPPPARGGDPRADANRRAVQDLRFRTGRGFAGAQTGFAGGDRCVHRAPRRPRHAAYIERDGGHRSDGQYVVDGERVSCRIRPVHDVAATGPEDGPAGVDPRRGRGDVPAGDILGCPRAERGPAPVFQGCARARFCAGPGAVAAPVYGAAFRPASGRPSGGRPSGGADGACHPLRDRSSGHGGRHRGTRGHGVACDGHGVARGPRPGPRRPAPRRTDR